MTLVQRYKIIIAGGGPAGLAAALHIARLAPALAADMLVLEAAEYPRPKLCGGGVTVHGEEQLLRLGLRIDVPAFVVQRITFRLGVNAFTVPCANAMRIIQREEFDAALAQAAADRALAVHTNERLLDLQPAADGVTLTTNRAQYHATVLIGADGANSTVRRRLHLHSTVGVARLLRVLTPLDPHVTPAWRRQTAVFDFSCIMQGIQGYVWDFPCYVNGRAFMNRGIFDSRILPQPAAQRANLKQTFADGLDARAVDLADVPLQGHPVRWFNPDGVFARPHVLLTGDAAGVDPLFAEGISYAMEYGAIVAGCVRDAFASGDYSFDDYRQRLLNHRLGRLLKRRTLVAKSLYGYRRPRLWTLLWRLARIAPPRMQRRVGASLALLPP